MYLTHVINLSARTAVSRCGAAMSARRTDRKAEQKTKPRGNNNNKKNRSKKNTTLEGGGVLYRYIIYCRCKYFVAEWVGTRRTIPRPRVMISSITSSTNCRFIDGLILLVRTSLSIDRPEVFAKRTRDCELIVLIDGNAFCIFFVNPYSPLYAT